MSDFVEKCRAEWKRLGVPDPLAEEMATDLASDLAEAEAEGISAQEYLGSSAFDPDSFATSWALGRGIIPEPPDQEDAPRKPRFLVAFTALSAIAVLVAAVLLLTGQPKLSLVASKTMSPGITRRQVLHSTSASAPVEWILLVLAIAALAFAAWLWSSWHHTRRPTTTG